MLLCLVLQPPLWRLFCVWGSDIRDRSSCFLDLAVHKVHHCSYFLSQYSCTPLSEVLSSWWLEDSWIMPIFSMLDTKARATVRPWKLWGQQIGWQISAGKRASSWSAVQTSLALRWCWISVQRTALSWQRQNTVSSSLIHTKVEFGVLYFSFFWLWLQRKSKIHCFSYRRSRSSTAYRGLQRIHVPVCRGEKINSVLSGGTMA